MSCREAAKQEVIRRYYKALVNEKRFGRESTESDRIAIIMGKLGIDRFYRPVVKPALQIERKTKNPGTAIQLQDGRIITGKTSALLGPSAAMLLNALKELAGIPHDVHLLAPESIEPIQTLKTEHLGSRNPRLHTDEVLIALSVSATPMSTLIERWNNSRRCAAATFTPQRSWDQLMKASSETWA